ncbi:MAG: site-2 protease family protein [Gemmatimonadota bacterium]|nr:site-2 protease family protein [Gemmatimonadota bacterium]
MSEPSISQFFTRWGGAEPGERQLRELAPRRERWWLHALLLIATFLTTSVGGAALAGTALDPGAVPSHLWIPRPATVLAGLPFSLPLLAILLAHEAGHYVAARRYLVDVSPPWFIPMVPQWSAIGTMGAFIRLRSPFVDRRTLFDVGIAGPLAGLLIALPVLAVGIALSHASELGPRLPFSHQFVLMDGGPVMLGDSFLLVAMRRMISGDAVLGLHPTAVAGWVGLFVTMINLLPLAQLDGGHLAFALFGDRQLWIARLFWLGLLPLGMLWHGWWLWAAIGLLLGRGRLAHPPLLSAQRPLCSGRRRLGYLVIAIFLLTFMPLPFIAP